MGYKSIIFLEKNEINGGNSNFLPKASLWGNSNVQKKIMKVVKGYLGFWVWDFGFFDILAQVSRKATVLLNTRWPAVVSGSTVK